RRRWTLSFDGSGQGGSPRQNGDRSYSRRRTRCRALSPILRAIHATAENRDYRPGGGCAASTRLTLSRNPRSSAAKSPIFLATSPQFAWFDLLAAVRPATSLNE